MQTRNAKKFAKRCLQVFWLALREWCGDAAYEKYLESAARRKNPNHVLSPTDFYLEQVRRRYSQPNRCC
jgi:uncharacterized short protein YbdD (DUF466 family)